MRATPSARRLNPVYRAVNRPLTILGAERRLFFGALVVGGASFNMFGSLLCGLLLFGALLLVAQLATRTDPQLPRILMNAGRLHPLYDPAKPSRCEVVLERVSRHGSDV